jgi:hypothetical protein
MIQFAKQLIMIGATLGGLAIIMTQDERKESSLLLLALTVVCWAFVLWYGLFSPWRVTAGGKALMYTTASMGILCLFLTTSWAFGKYGLRDEVRSTMLLALVLSFLYRLLLLPGYQRLDRASRRKRTADAHQALADLNREDRP